MSLGFITIKIAANRFVIEDYGIYNISRRVISLITFPVLLGLGISVPRYISMGGIKNQTISSNYWYSAIFLLFFSFLLFRLFFFSFSNIFFSYFNYEALELYSTPILISIGGLSLITLCYSYFRVINIKIANLVNIFIAIMPIFGIVFGESRLYCVIFYTGIGWLFVASLFVIIISYKNLENFEFRKSRQFVSELVFFGSPRVVGEFALFGFFAIPVFVSANIYSLVYSSFLGLAISIFQLFVSLLDFINVILLPRVGDLLAKKEVVLIQREINFLLKLSIIYYFLTLLFVFFFIEFFIVYFFGEKFLPSSNIFLILSISLLPYIVYSLLRNVLDVFSKVPYNAINLSLSLIIILVLLYLKIFTAEWAIVLGVFILGFNTYFIYKFLLQNIINESSREISL